MLSDNHDMKKNSTQNLSNSLVTLSGDSLTQTTVAVGMPTIVIAFFSGINFHAITQAAEQPFNQSFSSGPLRNSLYFPD